jgi:NarL family two-component system response regulator LiaR
MTHIPLPPADRIRVLIVDDHAVVRQGLRSFLELQSEVSPPLPGELPIEVVGEAEDGEAAVALAACLQPDIVLLDLVMPGLDGLHATPQILKYSPVSRVIILTSFGEEDKIIPAIRAGAQGYLLKDIDPAELVRSIRLAHQGQAPTKNGPDKLTEREQEVLQLVARGLSNRQIAEQMVISEKTVKSHVSNLLDKLSLNDRTQAAIYAQQHGLAEDQA